MTFTEPLFGKVLNREKTQTRRPVKEGEELWFAADSPYKHIRRGRGGAFQIPTIVVVAADKQWPRIKWQVGRTYAVQRAAKGRRGGEKQSGRFLLKAIRRQYLQQITEHDAQAEGFVNRAHFFVFWDEIYAKQPALHFKQNPPVWVLEFEMVK